MASGWQGYCGSGFTCSLYFGIKIAAKFWVHQMQDIAFDDLPFAPTPLKPLSMPAAGLLIKWCAYQEQRDLLRK
jgi:hypothetical protein